MIFWVSEVLSFTFEPIYLPAIRRGCIAQVRIGAALRINGFSAPGIVVIPKRRCGSLSLNYCTSQRSAAVHRLYCGLKAIEQVFGIARGRDMARGSRVLVRSGSGTSSDAAEVMRFRCC